MFLGRSLNGSAPVEWHYEPARRALGDDDSAGSCRAPWLVEIGYVGSKGWGNADRHHLESSAGRVPVHVAVRDDATINFLLANVTNPFAGLVPGVALNNATVARSQLLRPFPQFTAVTTNASDGSTSYNSFQTKLEHRFSKGYQLLVGYTLSRFRERVSRLNATDTEFEDRLAGADTPHRLSIMSIYELPFGNGRKFGSNAGRLVDSFIGGWSFQAIGQFQSGFPIEFGNLYYNGDPSDLKVKY